MYLIPLRQNAKIQGTSKFSTEGEKNKHLHILMQLNSCVQSAIYQEWKGHCIPHITTSLAQPLRT